MSASTEAAPVAAAVAEPSVGVAVPRGSKTPWRTLLAMPLASAAALGVHSYASQNEQIANGFAYTVLLGVILGTGMVIAMLQRFWPGLRAWMRETCPILAAAVVLLGVWELITSVLRGLPMP